MHQQFQLLAARPVGLAERLRQLAQGRDALDVAQFQFVGLEDISSAYGERWSGEKERVQGVAEQYLRRRMDTSDLLIRASGGFLVVFGSAAGTEAAVAAGQLSHGLNEYFLGDHENVPAPRFEVASNSIAVAELATCLGDAIYTNADAEPESAHPPGLSNIDWRYLPVWDVARETLSNWWVSPYWKNSHTRLPGYQFENVAERASQFAPIDEASLSLSEQAIKELIGNDKQALIGVSIHARTLANVSARARILSVLDRLERSLCRYRILKIAGVAPGFPRLYLNEMVQLLKARTSNVVVGATWDEPDMAGLLNSRPAAVGVTLPASVIGASASVPAQTLMAKLKKDVDLAHACKVRFFVEGDIPPRLATQLVGIGVNNISSPRIWPARGAPDAMLCWPASRLAA